MKAIAFLTEKGGSGKTTQSFNFAEYLAHNGSKVLLIDMDQQMSLSNEIYAIRDAEGTSVNMFRNTPINTHRINNNLDFIPSSLALDLVEAELMPKELRALTLSFWFEDHGQKLVDNYDYIIFDCHPDFKTVNQNIAAFCDCIISPLEPSILGTAAKYKIEARFEWLQKQIINPATRKTLITTKLFFINNLVDTRNKESCALIEETADEADVVATLPKRQLFVKSIGRNEPLVLMAENSLYAKRYKPFFDHVFEQYDALKQAID